MFKILITTVPFGEIAPEILTLLEQNNKINYTINPLGRKLKEDELAELIPEYDILIAGTESITRKVLTKAGNLKMISRVGIGLDSVDLAAANDFNIAVTYTPDAPAPAVAELTIGQMINLLRNIPLSDRKLREGIWYRYSGSRLSNSIIGIIGTGRIGSRVLKHLKGFECRKIFVNDLSPDYELYRSFNAEYVPKDTIFKNCDLISLHVPLTDDTYGMISLFELNMMKKNIKLINTSRGGIINEVDLFEFLQNNPSAMAAIDVFEEEPYYGKLVGLNNCILSCHMGSMTDDCRAKMELQATQEVIRFINGEPLLNVVPAEELKHLFKRRSVK